MLPDSLNTNQVKNSAGTEVEFSLNHRGNGQALFSKVGGNPSARHLLSIGHQETGTGVNRIRRSKVRFDYEVYSDLDPTKVVTISAYANLVIPVGHLTTFTSAKDCLANLNSFLATTGAGTTVLFDGTGSGSVALLDGSL